MTKEQKALYTWFKALWMEGAKQPALPTMEYMVKQLCMKTVYDEFQTLLGEAFDSIHGGAQTSTTFPVASQHYHLVFTAQTEIVLSTPNGQMRLTVEPK